VLCLVSCTIPSVISSLLKNKNQNRCIASRNDLDRNGEYVIAAECNPANPGQDWELIGNKICNKRNMCLGSSEYLNGENYIRHWAIGNNAKGKLWTYNDISGELKNGYGLCLFYKKVKSGEWAHSYVCETNNQKDKIWSFEDC